MRTALVILNRKQEAYAPRIAESVSRLDPMPDRVLVVLDRPTLVERRKTEAAYRDIPGCELLPVDREPDIVGRPQMVVGEANFCAGACRDAALEHLGDSYDFAIFTDGDCMPRTGLVGGHVATAEAAGGGSLVTVGRRLEFKWDLRDQREVSKDYPIRIFRDGPYRVTEEEYFVDSGVVWTCNFGISRQAVEAMRDIQGDLYGYRKVFSPDFAGRWGGEDGFVGFVCLYSGIPIWSVPPADSDGIVHIEHERPARTYDHVAFLAYMESRRRELYLLLEARGYELPRFRNHSEIIGDRSWQ